MKYHSWSMVAYEIKVVFKQGLHAQACNGYINFHLSSSFICWFCTGWLWSISESTWGVLICWHYCPLQWVVPFWSHPKKQSDKHTSIHLYLSMSRTLVFYNFLWHTQVSQEDVIHKDTKIPQFFIIFLKEIRTYSCICFGVTIAFENVSSIKNL